MTMRAKLLSVVLGALVLGGWTFDYRDRIIDGAMYVTTGIVTLFSAPYDGNGIEAAATAPTVNGTDPTVTWWCDDRLGASGLSSHTFVEHGSVELVSTPFCSDGSWSDLTTGDCLHACRFDGSNDYFLSTDNDVGDMAGADMTFCGVWRHDVANAGTDHVVAAQREGANSVGEGWRITDSGSVAVKSASENHAGTAVNSTINYTTTDGSYTLVCVSYDFDGNQVSYQNGALEDTDAMPGGTIDTASTKLAIGSASDGGMKFYGDIVAAWIYPTAFSAADDTALWQTFQGILDDKGAAVTATTSGPVCHWFGTELECFGDDWVSLGSSIPGGTGAGEPDAGLFSGQSYTNSLPYSRDLSTGWAETGVAVISTGATDLWADGRQGYKLTDDDAGSIEWAYSNIPAHGLSNGSKVQICVYAKGDDASQALDGIAREIGGVCGGGATSYPFTATAITASWTQYEFTHTITDDTCTGLTLYLGPTDFDDVANTGHAHVVAQVFLDQDYCPPIYCETEASAVTCGGDYLFYSAANLVDGTGTLKLPITVSFDYTPSISGTPPGSSYFFVIWDTSTGEDYFRFYRLVNGKLYVTARSTEEGSARLLFAATSGWLPTAGVKYSFEVDITATAATVLIDGSPQAGANTPITSLPNSLDGVSVGTFSGGSAQNIGHTENFKVTSP